MAMRILAARALLIGAGVAAGAGGTVVATTVISDDDRGIIRAHIVEYVDAACLESGTVNRDTVGLLHTGSGRKRFTQAQHRASGRLDSLFAQKCVNHYLVVDTLPAEAPPDTVTPPDTSVQPDTLPTPPDTTPAPPDTVVTPPDTTTPPDTSTGPAPQDTTARILALVGPTITPAAATALGGGYALYDPLWIKWELTRFTAEGTVWAGNYYDRAQIYYAQCIRLANPLYCQRGEAMALDYRRNYLHASNYQTSPHWAQLDGVALHYWMTGDDSSRIAVGKAAWNLAAGTITWTTSSPHNDGRTQARALTGMLLAWQMNAPNAPTGGWAVNLDRYIDNVLSMQSPDGAWRYANTCMLSLNYMNAMLSDALIRVYEVYRADPRIPGAVTRNADWLWTQWRAGDAVPSFNYYEGACVNQHGSAGPTATPDLTGLFTTTFAWLAGQDPVNYQAKSDAVFLSTMRGLYPQGSKQFNQAFAYSWRALGYLPPSP